ncbi:MAG: SDR family oxidoreductase [Deltaproteobacteria bacterium]|nr:SDR family oxidoreductase [Deltaproteobacteria bacterium]MBW1961704.1 SDR family oxidoreductase [Deltaproteobacteria bacterium]MBW1993459.1 SDR family oxidoreductase [Deltaproteobacteria bacterium]MBW2151022.1 SDR family oxidoreductase [Deltaproteobacteria bacterium]
MTLEEKHLSNKVAWITGSSRGIGQSIIRHLAEAGANVVLHGTSPDSPRTFDEGESLQAIAREIEKKYQVRCLPVHGDLTQEDTVSRIVNQIHDEFERIDILVHCAGGDIGTRGVQAPLAGKPEKNDAVFVSTEDIRTVLNRNLLTCILCCRAVAPEMMQRKSGKIVTIGSIAGLKGVEYSVIYATAKAALHHYTRCLAVQLKPYNVNVNSVAPGDIVTERWKASRDYDQDKMVAGGTLNRYGRVEEISSVVEFLVSSKSSYISGQVIRVDGCVQPWPA